MDAILSEVMLLLINEKIKFYILWFYPTYSMFKILVWGGYIRNESFVAVCFDPPVYWLDYGSASMRPWDPWPVVWRDSFFYPNFLYRRKRLNYVFFKNSRIVVYAKRCLTVWYYLYIPSSIEILSSACESCSEVWQ